MMFLAKWFIVALSFLFAAYILPGIEIESFYTALILAFVWGLVNLIIKPIIILFTLPINIITFGLFTFIINGFLFWFLGTIIKGFTVNGFFIAIIGAIVVSFFISLGNKIISRIK